MRIWKKLLSVMLVLVMLSCLAPLDGFVDFDSFEFNASAKILSGTDKNISWVLNEAGELIVFGEGPIPERESHISYQWGYSWRNVKRIVIGYGITEIPDAAFFNCRYATEVVISGSVTKIEATAFGDCDSMQTVYLPLSCVFIGNANFTAWGTLDKPVKNVYYEGNEEQFNAIKWENGNNFKNATKHYNSSYDYYYPEGSGEEEPEEPIKIFPDGYDFEVDSYEFENDDWEISKKYFTTLFEESTGTLLYNVEGGPSGGCCFGMAYTTALFYTSKPKVTSITKKPRISDEKCSALREAFKVSTFDLNNLGEISVLDYIKYVHMYKYSTNWQTIILSTVNDTEGLVEIVQECVKNNHIGVGICFNSKVLGCHEVLAVGVEKKNGATKIYIDDPNCISQPNVLTINSNKSWSYSGINAIPFSSEDSEFVFSYDISVPYDVLLTGKKLSVYNDFIDPQSNATETYVEEMQKIDADNNLIKIPQNAVIDQFNVVEINVNPRDYENNAKTSNKLYWVDSEETITASGFSDETNEVALAGDNTILTANVTKDSTVQMTIDEEDINTVISTEKGEEYTVSVETIITDENYENVETEVTISGTASADEITATQTDTGLVVTGIDNGKITLTQNEEVIATKRITEATGDVEITYDATGETTDLDAQFPHECDDYNHNGKCDICTEVMEAVKNCDCMCHKSGFMSLVYAFVNLFWRLFGTNKACECGVHHW